VLASIAAASSPRQPNGTLASGGFAGTDSGAAAASTPALRLQQAMAAQHALAVRQAMGVQQQAAAQASQVGTVRMGSTVLCQQQGVSQAAPETSIHT